jgi:uncharacterized protein YndB with AHSA1/START domain
MNQTAESYGVYAEADAVRFERTLPGPIETVWAYLTVPEKRGKWLAAGPMELRVGGRIQLDFKHSTLSPTVEPTPERYKKMEAGVSLFGRVTRIEAPRILSYTWGEEDGRESEVTFELTERGKDVLLVLTHRRLVGRDTMISVSGGWHTHLGILEDQLSGREPRPFWSTHERLVNEYRNRLPQAAA